METSAFTIALLILAILIAIGAAVAFNYARQQMVRMVNDDSPRTINELKAEFSRLKESDEKKDETITNQSKRISQLEEKVKQQEIVIGFLTKQLRDSVTVASTTSKSKPVTDTQTMPPRGQLFALMHKYLTSNQVKSLLFTVLGEDHDDLPEQNKTSWVMYLIQECEKGGLGTVKLLINQLHENNDKVNWPDAESILG